MRSFVAILMLASVSVLGLALESTASAAVLCNANEAPCASENTYEKGEAFVFQTLKATINTNLGTITCGGNFGGVISLVGGEGVPVEAQVNGVNFTECKESKGFACSTATAKNLPYTAKFEGSGGSGTLTISDPMAVAMEFSCAQAPIQCTFSAAAIGFSVTGGTPATANATNVPLSVSGSQCPATATFSSEFTSQKVFSFPSLFIVDGAAPPPAIHLCKQNVSFCNVFLRYLLGTTLEGALAGNSIFEFLYEGKPREPACETGTMTSKATEAGKPLIGEVSALSFSNCGAGVCAVEAQSLPYKSEFEKTTGGNGTMALVSGGSGSPKIEVNCGKAFKCIYKATSVSFTLTGGNPASISVAKTMEKDAASEAECGSTMTWTATYELTKPTPLFVT